MTAIEKNAVKEQILSTLVSELKSEFSTDLRAVVLYGSMVDQTKSTTDFDVFVIVEKSLGTRPDRIDLMLKIENRLGSELRSAALIGCHWEISLKLKTLQESDHFSPLYLDWVDRSRILYEDESTAATKIIHKTAEWIFTSGAKKYQRGLLWYWDLMPDLKPGEERKIGW